MEIKVNFGNKIGKIKPMHGVNNGPRSGGAGLRYDASEYFKNAKIPIVRLHDTEGAYGANQYVDIHCIFPDFSADEEKEESYNFKATDNYLTAIKNAGSEIFYRLGESIDHYEKQLFVLPPKNYLKWAKICEHIILHYNYGWANGFHFDIKYWEIWNEPDNKRMWTGTHDEFFELYRVTANYLKEKFPALKIGGYAASGFYVKNRKAPSEWFKTLVPYMHDFFKYITSEKTKAPMDFFSWHCYAEHPKEVSLHAAFAKELLEEYGLKDCESILDEYNTFDSLGEYPGNKISYAAEVAATLIEAQKSLLDMLMYYDMRFIRMNGVLKVVDYTDIVPLPAYWVFEFFGKLYSLGGEAETETSDESAYVLAACGKDEGAVLISAYETAGKRTLRFEGAACDTVTITTLDGTGGRTEEKRFIGKENDVEIEIQQNCVYLIVINKKSGGRS